MISALNRKVREMVGAVEDRFASYDPKSRRQVMKERQESLDSVREYFEKIFNEEEEGFPLEVSVEYIRGSGDNMRVEVYVESRFLRKKKKTFKGMKEDWEENVKMDLREWNRDLGTDFEIDRISDYGFSLAEY